MWVLGFGLRSLDLHGQRILLLLHNFRLNVDWWRPSSYAQHWKLEVRGMKACFSPQETMKAKEAAGHTKN